MPSSPNPTCAPTPPGCWCRRRSTAAAVTSGCSSHPANTCCSSTRDHDSAAVDSILADYQGYLVADAHAVYDHLYQDGSTIEVNCWAHARRYFSKAMASDPRRAEIALKLIGVLFRHERAFADKPRKRREQLRAKHSAPVIERFFSWCDAEWPLLLESTPIYDGVRYARNQRKGLSRFLTDSRLPIDNNISERELRRQAVGRNYAEAAIMRSDRRRCRKFPDEVLMAPA